MSRFEKFMVDESTSLLSVAASSSSRSVLALLKELKLTSREELLEIEKQVGVIGMLAGYGYARGVRVNLRRSHASTVNPWLLVVNAVSDR